MPLVNKVKLLLICLILFGGLASTTFAAPENYTLLEPTLIGQSSPVQIGDLEAPGGATSFAAYFQLLYQMLMGIGVLACIFYFVWGGFTLMVSTVPGVKENAKKDIYRSLEGLAFILGAYLILNTINPRLTHINIGLIQINSSATNDNIFSPGTNNVYDPPASIINSCADGNKTTMSYIIANEGWRNKPYPDSGGRPTIGVGHLIKPGEDFSAGLTDEQVGQLFLSDYNEHYNEARRIASNNGVNLESLTPRRQTVIIDMTFNMRGSLNEFQNMWAAIRTEDWPKAGAEILDSDYASDTGNRARANAAIMENDNDSPINQRISADPKAKNYCQ